LDSASIVARATRADGIGYDAPMLKNVALALSGLVAGVLTASLLVPRVLADPPRPPNAVRWQQFCEPASSIAEASSMSGARGVEGWELVGFFGGALCFKRPAPPTSAAPSAPTAGGNPTWPGY
jgi:hypothetical protein